MPNGRMTKEARADRRSRRRAYLEVELIGSVPASIPNPLSECNSDLAQYSTTPTLHHSAWPDSRTKRLVSHQSAPSRNRVPGLVSAFVERDRSSSSTATRLRVEGRRGTGATG